MDRKKASVFEVVHKVGGIVVSRFRLYPESCKRIQAIRVFVKNYYSAKPDRWLCSNVLRKKFGGDAMSLVKVLALASEIHKNGEVFQTHPEFIILQKAKREKYRKYVRAPMYVFPFKEEYFGIKV